MHTDAATLTNHRFETRLLRTKGEVTQRANRWVVQLAGGDLWRFIAQCVARDGP